MEDHSTHSKAFLFAGQGNPVIGMGSDLWDINPTVRRIWDCASDISQLDIRRLCAKGPMNKLIQTQCQQVAVTAINVTLFTYYCDKFERQHSDQFCGHSVGEYAALYAAEAITLENLFKMITFRAQLMHELSQLHQGAMYAVKGANYQELSDLITRSAIDLDISCDNSCKQQVIGWTTAALREFSRVLANEGYQASKLGVSGAWHTRLMADGVAQMRDFLASVEIKPPSYDVLMNVTGAPEKEPETIRQNLSLHLTHTVKWTDSMENLLQNPLRPLFIEVSNKAYLTHLLQDNPSFIPNMFLHCRNI